MKQTIYFSSLNENHIQNQLISGQLSLALMLKRQRGISWCYVILVEMHTVVCLLLFNAGPSCPCFMLVNSPGWCDVIQCQHLQVKENELRVEKTTKTQCMCVFVFFCYLIKYAANVEVYIYRNKKKCWQGNPLYVQCRPEGCEDVTVCVVNEAELKSRNQKQKQNFMTIRRNPKQKKWN